MSRKSFVRDKLDLNRMAIKKWRHEGETNIYIADKLNVNSKTLQDYCVKNKFYTKKGRPKKWIFTDIQKENIRKMRISGMMHKEIAVQYSMPTYVIAAFCQLNKIYPKKEIMPEGMKKCTDCKETKLYECFGKNKRNTVLGLSSYCKDCKKEMRRKWYYEKGGKEKLKKQKQTTEYKLKNSEYAKLPYRKAWKRNHENERSKNDPVWRLNRRVSTNMRCSLRNGKEGYHWEELVGWTLID